MDLSDYLKKNRASHSRFGSPAEKFCLECGRKIEHQSNFLSQRSFCSEECKQKYVESGSK